ncbi:hypothetical protein OG921_24090 [Aldersonia sp. NBC_00410]|uniref:hypothetical protein n=1 Tax=Aldersonia sp. NBC_00410 TaxID=2975954 RepID=UPI00224EC375|nr:hypothetical protein [Aldersonia sp. NBC_00410]MCX5046256.1 hypothetical protein [Aldersonia sp. NBC_00410]
MSRPTSSLTRDGIVDLLLAADGHLDEPIPSRDVDVDASETSAPEGPVSDASDFIKSVLSGAAAGTAVADPVTVASAPEDDDPFDRSLRGPAPAETPSAAAGPEGPDTQSEPDEDSEKPRWRAVTERALSRWKGAKGRTKLACVAGVAVVIVVGFMRIAGGEGGDQTEASPFVVVPGSGTEAPAASAGPGTASPAPSAGDHPLRPVSVSSRCPAGSTDPMQAFDSDLDTAWECVRVYGIDGQVLTVHLDHPYVITSMGIVPGWNKTNADGSDEWVKHRTVSTVKYGFDDTAHSTFTEQTQSVRDEVVTPITTPVLASVVQITILATAEPTGAGPGQGDTGFAVGPVPANEGGASDFAVSSITITGHPAS